MSATAVVREVTALVDAAEASVREAFPRLFDQLEAQGGAAVVSTRRLREAIARGDVEPAGAELPPAGVLRAAADVLDPVEVDGYATAQYSQRTARWLRRRADTLDGRGLVRVRPESTFTATCCVCLEVRRVGWMAGDFAPVCLKCGPTS